MTPSEFIKMLNGLKIGITSSRAILFMAKLSTSKTILPFEDFFNRILGVDKMILTGAKEMPQKKMKEKTRYPHPAYAAPKGTSVEKMTKRFVMKLRESLFNIPKAIRTVLRIQKAEKALNEDDLWYIFRENGIMVHPRRRIEELMRYFDHDADGRLNGHDIIHEILGFEPAKGSSYKWRRPRPPIDQNSRDYIEGLRQKAERAACPPDRLRGFFKAYDTHSTGELGYEQLKIMVRAMKADIGGIDMAAEMLSRWSNGRGALTYKEFSEIVLSMSPSSMMSTQEIKTSSTCSEPTLSDADIMSKVAKEIKNRIYKNESAVKEAFSMFDRHQSGEIDPDDFREGIKSLGVPATKSQMKAMFQEWDADGGGTLDREELAAVILGTTQPLEEESATASRSGSRPSSALSRSPSRSPSRSNARSRPQSALGLRSQPPMIKTSTVRSAGGAPRMPKEFLPDNDRCPLTCNQWPSKCSQFSHLACSNTENRRVQQHTKGILGLKALPQICEL